MRTIALKDGADFDGWRNAARALLLADVPPEQVTWLVSGEASLLLDQDERPGPASVKPTPRIPAEFLGLMESLICHSDPQRYGLAYRLLWRLTHGERNLLQLITDSDVLRARNAEKSVRRDSHKMKAFVRFREVPAGDGESVFIAWFEPQHYIVERVAPFFVRRFTGMRWSILTPYRSAHWDGASLSHAQGATKADAPGEDVFETYWRTYFANIFNPARLKVQAMKSEMPMKYWKNLPEAQLIPQLIRDANPRTLAMIEAAPTVPNQRIPAAKLPKP
ncbi:MAG: TIGR03915 family putative DNA repair protein [Pseudomonadota bacterium]